MFFKLPVPAFARQRNGFSFTPATLPDGLQGGGGYYRVVAGAQPVPGKTRWRQCGQKKSWLRATSTQKRLLKLKLIIRRWTRTTGKDELKMFHRLQQGIRVRTDRWRLLAAELRAKNVQPLPQPASQPVKRFQREGQPQGFDRSLDRKSGEQFCQPRPHQRSRHRMPRQHLRQEERKSAPATAALPAIGTKHPLPPAAAMRTRRLLEGKSCVFNSCASRTK